MKVSLPYTVTRHRRTLAAEPDALGRDQWTTTTDTIPVAGWATPSSAEPKLAGHERVVVDIELYAPQGHLRHDDEVTVDGKTFHVIGAPENYSKSPFGFDPGLEVVNLRSTSG